MGVEIERKFLVVGDSWRRNDPPGVRFCQGYLAQGSFTPQRITRPRAARRRARLRYH